MFETKENTSGEIKFTTLLGSGREPCQQAVQDFLGERLSHISNVSYFNIGIYSYRSSETDIEVQSFDIEVLNFDVEVNRYRSSELRYRSSDLRCPYTSIYRFCVEQYPFN